MAILYRNINSLNVLNLLENILEKNPHYLDQNIYDNMLKIRTESSLFKNILNLIKKFSNIFLSKETIDLLCEKCQINEKEKYQPIIELILLFYNKNNISEITLKNKDIFDIETKEEKSMDYLKLLQNFINTKNFIPERYFYKIFKLIKEEIKLNKEGWTIILLAINKNFIIPKEIIEQLLENKTNELYLKLIQSLLTNKKYKKIYNKKLMTILEQNTKEINIKIINNLLSLVDFINLEDSVKEFILKNLNLYFNDSQSDYKKICFWIFQDNSYNNKLLIEMKKSKFCDNFKDFEKIKKYEEKSNFFLNEDIFNDKIKELSDNDNEKFNKLKTSINNFENKVLKDQNEKKLKLLKLINFFISQKIKYNLNFKEIIQCFDTYLTNDNYLQYHLKFENATENYFNILRKNWIKLKIINKNLKYSTETINSFIDNFYIYNFDDNLIEKMINLSLFSNIEEINKIFDFLKDNEIYLNDIKNVISKLNKDDSTEIFINKSILSFSLKKISESNVNPKFKDFYLLLIESLIKIKWKLYQIDELLSKEIKFDTTLKESELKDILINVIEKNNIFYDSKNNKNENLIKILTQYESKYWEYLIKELAQIQNSGSLDEKSLENLILELKEKNKDFSDELSQKIKNFIMKLRYLYNKKIEDDKSLPDYPIKNYEKKDIQKWSKSKRTQSLINNEEFLPEAIAIINRAVELEENHNLRDVQIISVLLIFFSPKNRGVFAQIKTGEGKSTIVSVIAVIKALQYKYVDVLSSSIILAQRDKNEKKTFYDYFNLTVGSNDDDDDEEEIPLYKKNIVYGDTLMFEGDILSLEFSRNPNSKRAKNPNRGFKCIIIDEVDSMCIDNLGSSTRLSSSFPSYEYLKIIYPLIYNNLNLIDEHMDKGFYGKIEDEEQRKSIVVENLIDVTEKLIKENKENPNYKEVKFLLPKNLKSFIKNQIKYWCNTAYQAKHYYKENVHYVIGKDSLDDSMKEILIQNGYIPEEYYKIGTVDFSNTGVVSLNMTWSDGLTQFLQIKHGLKLKSEDLSTIFISHYSFFKRYFNANENNIFGVTGTIGTKKSKLLLQYLFNVNIYIIPPFKQSKLILLNNKANFKNKEEWQKEILNSIEINTKIFSRAVLIICFTIQDTDELYELLIKNGYNKDKIDKYQRNDDKSNKLKEYYDKGDIIIATNLAGRGTDIKLSEEVKKNGGLHVIVTFLPSNQRVEEQAIGRTARSGAKGSSLIIVNDSRNIETIKQLRDFREEFRMEYIRTKTIDKIKLKDELFNKFSLFYHELQSKWIDKDLSRLNPFQYAFIKKKYLNEFSILNDIEEKWGNWLKEMRIDEMDYNNKSEKSEKEINEKYKTFEETLKKIYSDKKINDIDLSNPLNYLCAERYTLAYEKDSELCFFSNYLNDMSSIKNKTKDITNKITDNLDKTISSLKDDLCSQIQAIAVLANGIKNKEIFCGKKMEELSQDAENKLKVIENLINQLEENKSMINQYLEKKKGKLVPNLCDLTKFTKSLSIINYFKDIGIPYFYEITLKKEKNWFGIVSVIVIGAFEIALGVILTYYMHNDFGLLKEGINDIQYGIKCLMGEEEFDWKEVGKRKLSFAINLAINVALSFIRGNLKLPFAKKDRSLKQTFDIIKEKAKEKMVKEGVNKGIQLSMKIFGKDFVVSIVAKFKEYSKNLTITFFKDTVKKKIEDTYGDTFKKMLTIEIVSGKNDWTKILTEELKVCCRALSKITGKIVSCLTGIIEMIIKDRNNWKDVLANIFKDCLGDIFDIFKGSLNECLENLILGFLNVFKKFADKKLPDKVKNGLLTFNDLLDKALDIGDSLKSQNLMEFLVGNNIIDMNGIINGKLLFGESYRQKKMNPIPIIIDKFRTSLIQKALGANNLVDYINQSVENITNEIENLIKKKVEEGISLINNLINEKMISVNNFIDEKFNQYVLTTIDNIEMNINKGINKIEDFTDKIKEGIINKSKQFDDFSSNLEKNLNEKIAKIEEVTTQIKNTVNDKIKLFEDIVDKQIDEKITKIKNYISDFEDKVNTKIDEFKTKLSSEYKKMFMDILTNTSLSEKTEKIGKKIEEITSKLGEKVDDFKKLINDVKSSIDEKVEEFNNIWNKIKNSEQLEKVKNTIKKIKSFLESEIIEKIINLMNNTKNKISEAIAFIKNIVSKIVEKLNKLKEILKNSKESIPKKKELIKKELNELKEEFKKKINEIKEYIINLIASLQEKIFEKISDFTNEIKSNFKGYVDLLKELIEKIENSIKEKLDKIEEKLDLNVIGDLLNEIGEGAKNIFNSNITEQFKEKINNADKLLSNKIHNALDDIDFKEFKDKKAKIIDTLKDYQKKINEFDIEAAKNEKFQIFQNIMVNSLIDVIVEAISSTEVGQLLKGKIDEYKKIIDETTKLVEESIEENSSKKK